MRVYFKTTSSFLGSPLLTRQEKGKRAAFSNSDSITPGYLEQHRCWLNRFELHWDGRDGAPYIELRGWRSFIAGRAVSLTSDASCGYSYARILASWDGSQPAGILTGQPVDGEVPNRAVLTRVGGQRVELDLISSAPLEVVRRYYFTIHNPAFPDMLENWDEFFPHGAA